jgi:hypothetical protein
MKRKTETQENELNTSKKSKQEPKENKMLRDEVYELYSSRFENIIHCSICQRYKIYYLTKFKCSI